MKHLKRINELYEGPGKRIGFKPQYMKPKEEYIISVDMIIDPSVDIPHFRKSIKQIIKSCGIIENWYRLTKFNKDGDLEVDNDTYSHIEVPSLEPKDEEEPNNIYTLAIALTAFHKYEAESALNEILGTIMDKYGDKIFFDEKHINLGGTDIDTDPKKIGFEIPTPKPKEPTDPRFKKVTKKTT